MLTMTLEVPEGAAREAADYAYSCFSSEGRDTPFEVTQLPFQVYVANGTSVSAMHPDRLTPATLRFAVLGEAEILGFVTVDCSVEPPSATAMDVVEANSQALRALWMADEFADRPGQREIRVIEIPVVDAVFYWVTGPEPRFIDQIAPGSYSQSKFLAELTRRLAEKKTFDPDPDPDPDPEPEPDPEPDGGGPNSEPDFDDEAEHEQDPNERKHNIPRGPFDFS